MTSVEANCAPASETIVSSVIDTKPVIRRRDGAALVACYPDQYEELLTEKVKNLCELLNWQSGGPEHGDDSRKPVDVYRSPLHSFRMRANFQMWHDDNRNKTPDGFYYCMFDEEKRHCEVKSFPRGSKRINELMPRIMQLCRDEPAIFRSLFEVRFLTTRQLQHTDESIRNSSNNGGSDSSSGTTSSSDGDRSGGTGTSSHDNKSNDHSSVSAGSCSSNSNGNSTDTVCSNSSTDVEPDALVVLCYKQPLTAQWQQAAARAATQLHVKIIGRARKMKIVVCPRRTTDVAAAADVADVASTTAHTSACAAGDELLEQETIVEHYAVKGAVFKYLQTEGAFTQPNAAVCQHMLTWAADRTEDTISRSSDLLELYCGGGTFTAALAGNFRRVLATEISKASVQLATRNFALNDVKNIRIARLSAEEFSDAYRDRHSNGAPLRRLRDAGIDLNSYDIRTVLVDPPRAGLDAATCSLLSQFERIVYISCNPQTLARDVQLLRNTHDVLRVAAFDQFPYTHHLEGGVYMVKKQQQQQPLVVAQDIKAAAATAIDTTVVSTVAGTSSASADSCSSKKRVAEFNQAGDSDNDSEMNKARRVEANIN